MKAFSETKQEREDALFLKLMHGVESNPLISQRALASEMEVAFGLANTYIKRCVSKGWLRVKQIPAKRYAYYITPKGFQEKSRLAANYLQGSFDFFRQAKSECEAIFTLCEKRGFKHVALLGNGDLAEIATLVANKEFFTTVCVNSDELCVPKSTDAFIITDTLNPQKTYDFVLQTIGATKPVFAPPLLHISFKKPSVDEV